MKVKDPNEESKKQQWRDKVMPQVGTWACMLDVNFEWETQI